MESYFNMPSIVVTVLIGLISYIWVRLQRQIDKQQAVTQEQENRLQKLEQRSNGDIKLLNEKIENCNKTVGEIKVDVKDLTKSIYELKGSIQSHQSHDRN